MSDLNRRELLRLTGLSVAGVGVGSNSAGVVESVQADTHSVDDERTLRVGISAPVRDWDPAAGQDLNSAAISTELFYERPYRQTATGELRSWLVERTTLVDTESRTLAAYEPYGVHRETARDAGNAILAVLDPANPHGTADDRDLVLDTVGAETAVDDGEWGVVLEMEVRPGVTFHDGSALDAEVLRGSYERMIGTSIGPSEFNPWYLDSRVIDDGTITLYGLLPDARIRQLANLPVFSNRQVDLPPGAVDPGNEEPPLGTAPFKLESWEPGRSITATRFEDHWFSKDAVDWDVSEEVPEQPVFDVIEIEVIEEERTRSAALQQNQIDITHQLERDDFSDFDALDPYRVETATLGSFTFLSYPTQFEPWDDPRLRQAVNRLIPRQEIVDEIHQGWATPGWTRFPPGVSYEATTDFEDHKREFQERNIRDVDRSISLLEELAAEEVIDPPISIRLETNRDVVEHLQITNMLAAILEDTEFFDVSIESYSMMEWIPRIIDGYHERGHIAVTGLDGGSHPEDFVRTLHHSDNIATCCNLAGLDDPRLDELIDEARFDGEAARSLETRRDRWEEVWDHLADTQATSIVNFQLAAAAMNADLTGFTLSPEPMRWLSAGIWAPEDNEFAALGDLPIHKGSPQSRVHAPFAIEPDEPLEFTVELSIPLGREFVDARIGASEGRLGPVEHDGSGLYYWSDWISTEEIVIEDGWVQIDYRLDPTLDQGPSSGTGFRWEVEFEIEVEYATETFEIPVDFMTYTFESVEEIDVVPVIGAEKEISELEQPIGEELFDHFRTIGERANAFFASGLGTMGIAGRNFNFPTRGVTTGPADAADVRAGWLQLPFSTDDYLDVDPDEIPTLGEDLDPPLDAMHPNYDPDEWGFRPRRTPQIHACQLSLLSDAIETGPESVGSGSLLVAADRILSEDTRAAHWSWTPDHDDYEGARYEAMIWDSVDGGAWLHELGHHIGFPDLYASASAHETSVWRWCQMHWGDQFSSYVRAATYSGWPDTDWLSVTQQAVDGIGSEVEVDDLSPLSDLRAGDTVSTVQTAAQFQSISEHLEWFPEVTERHWLLEARRGGESALKRPNLPDQAEQGNLKYNPDDEQGIAVFDLGEEPLEPGGDGRVEYCQYFVTGTGWSTADIQPTLPERRSIAYDPESLAAFERLDHDVEEGGRVRVWQALEEPEPAPDFDIRYWPRITIAVNPTEDWSLTVFPHIDLPHPHEHTEPPFDDPLPPVDILVENGDGQLAGFDPETGRQYSDIPGSIVRPHGFGLTVSVPAADDLSVTVSGRRLREAAAEVVERSVPPVSQDRTTYVDTDLEFVEMGDEPPRVSGRVAYQTQFEAPVEGPTGPALSWASVWFEVGEIDGEEFIRAAVGLHEDLDPEGVQPSAAALNDLAAVSDPAYEFAPEPPIEDRDGEPVALLYFRRDAVLDLLGTGEHEVSVSGLVADDASIPFVGTGTLLLEDDRNGDDDDDDDDHDTDESDDDADGRIPDDTDDADDTDDSDDTLPGFGILGSVGALGGLAYTLRNRVGGSDDEDSE